MRTAPLQRVLERHRAVICVGPGGVGKTTVSAALAMQAAYMGHRTAVLTIDPARRLAGALGLPEIGSVERHISAEAFEAAGLTAPRGELSALMLDIKEAWDSVVSEHQPDAQRRHQLLSNRLYRAMSTALAGSQEYMAMEKLFSLSQRSEDRLDRVLLDTPPAQHAIDFLEAPSRMLNALSNDATRWLLEPYKRGGGRLRRRLFDAGSSIFVRTISKLTGAELLDELAELLLGMQGMFEGFQARADAVRRLLSSPETAFLVVSSASPSGQAQAEAFIRRLSERGVRAQALILNRATDNPFRGPPDGARLDAALRGLGADPDLSHKLFEEGERIRAAAEEEQAGAARLRQQLPVQLCPQLRGDVHELGGLDALRQRLMSGESTSDA